MVGWSPVLLSRIYTLALKLRTRKCDYSACVRIKKTEVCTVCVCVCVCVYMCITKVLPNDSFRLL